MLLLNDTSLTPVSFILNGIPGLEEVHLWVSFPLCTMYSIAITGNFGLMYLIYSEEALHRPMHIFLALLSFTDVLMCTSTLCDHMSVAKISCGNVKVNAIYGLMVALLIGGFDILCITVSYTMILQAVVSLSSAGARQKAFSTCTAHIFAIVITYVPAFFTFFTHRFGGRSIPPHIHIIMANLLMPPTMNPIVYGIKTKQI
ncbi:TPA: olfactory receptor, family 52, subfamily N, member 1 (predicted)-like [Bos taurus]|nr:TPA: olfactory receptor, family 52, subfamily N, member 1 (predicted)-like [Bos taurus]